MANMASGKLETYLWDDEGFKSLVEFGDWRVALINWEARFDAQNLGRIERHTQSDEVFVLLRGRSLLFVISDDGVEARDMKPSVVYNVPSGDWHYVVGTKDVTWLIVESRSTSLANTDYRQMSDAEETKLREQFPNWLR